MMSKRLLIGCGVVFVLAVAILVGGFAYWISRPGQPLGPSRLRDTDAIGYLEWRLDLEDAGTRTFVQSLLGDLVALAPRREDPLPPWLGGWIARQGQSGVQRDLDVLFPLVLVGTLHAGQAPGQESSMLAVHLEQLGNRLAFVDWTASWVVARDEDARVEAYRDEVLYGLGREGRPAFFIRDGNVFITTDLEAARRSVDRLDRRPAEVERGVLDDVLDATEALPLRGGVVNDRGALGRLWSASARAAGEAPEPALWQALESAALAGALAADGSLSATLLLRGPDPSWASTHAAALADSFERGFGWERIDLTVEEQVDGRTVRLLVSARLRGAER